MLPAKNRLGTGFFRKKKASKGKTLEGNDLKIKVLSSQGQFKLAVIVSKKVASKATDRNRIKRIITESLKEDLGKLQGEAVIIVKNNIASYKPEEVKKNLLGKFIKLYVS